MLFWVIAGTAGDIDLGYGVHVRSAAGTGLDLSVGVEVDDFVLSDPLATSVRAVTDKDAVAE